MIISGAGCGQVKVFGSNRRRPSTQAPGRAMYLPFESRLLPRVPREIKGASYRERHVHEFNENNEEAVENLS
jgi:hypothetical protein